MFSDISMVPTTFARPMGDIPMTQTTFARPGGYDGFGEAIVPQVNSWPNAAPTTDWRTVPSVSTVMATQSPNPISGLGDCGCSGFQSASGIGAYDVTGGGGMPAMGNSPDGLGEYFTTGLGDTSPGAFLTSYLTGNWMYDAVIGAGIGYFMGKDKPAPGNWVLGGAIAAGLAGTLGMLGTAAFGYARR